MFEDYLVRILIAVVFLVVLNVSVSLAIVRDDGLSSLQKFIQILVVWVLPFLGGVLMLALVGSQHTRDKLRSMVPFPFYLAGNPEPGTPNPFDHQGTEGSCGSDFEFSGDGD